jgi:ribosomal subunit interface protein
MELQITGKNIELTPTLRQLIERKLGKLSRHLPNIKEQKVEVYEEKTKSPEQRFVVEVTLDSNGILLRGVERGEDLPRAINKVAAVMDRQIERYKGKLYEKGRGSSVSLSPCQWLKLSTRWSSWGMIFSSSLTPPARNLTCSTGGGTVTTA